MVSRKSAEKQVKDWGFEHVFTHAYYPPPAHSGLTTHLIFEGELTISYPNDAEPRKETFGPGARLDVDAGRKHQVWMGAAGCTYVIGE
ncbi:hypothetical protein CLAFUW4_00956 [Fulvia fulva]|uniref:Uncharacterized protein n=1 Tax=Passalora fulva TaxID=5499 RepID=A0A9Q8L8Y7_PASFU|nr:uncharacterized protein CLAFUR5_00962 [Fulvia fulva]KAK4635670.1 hypothetical protein CLAFUR4_00957 [Fulvia fulva]KAK4637471.1 hypothetical protein CLAFUR0_00958 [Fulvia fulva]UJO12894.1 hypothetical protein CLAFUR5_00962 [Fulvia fulva]WPV08122.1 hypothetical protein CLAFUW4_00956 [Fulvia fulva]WPV25009.1 hypothetical protein CLAFUW7_00860 [Fulvia fulva]